MKTADRETVQEARNVIEAIMDCTCAGADDECERCALLTRLDALLWVER